MAKEYPKSMTDELLNVTSFKAKFPEDDWNTIAAASSYVMYLDESSNTMIKVFFDLESINKSFNIVKYATQRKVTFELTAESGLVLTFDALVVLLGKNHATFKIKRKDITDIF